MTLLEKYNNLKPIKITATPDQFFAKYSKVNTPIMNRLTNDLHNLLNDILWMKESGNENEQYCLDFLDAVNHISTSI